MLKLNGKDKETAEIGIFGGTGIYDSGLLKEPKEIAIDTPYGKPSDTITIGEFHGRKIAFLPRHGKKHTIPPHMINYRANIWAFKELGVKRIIAPSAVGSLKEEFAPRDFALPTQFLDFTKSRKVHFLKMDESHSHFSCRSILSRITKSDFRCSRKTRVKNSQRSNICLY